jgi:hypothetical protein
MVTNFLRMACALSVLTLSACALVPPQHAPDEPGGPTPPYPYSHYITQVTWDFSGLESLRRAHGSDIWPCAWATDGDLYCAWGDGGGFDGDSNTAGRVSLGFARVSGAPSLDDPDSFAGRNVWGDAPQYAQEQATFGGKVHALISVGGTLYGYAGLWTEDNTPNPVHHSGRGPLNTLVWSADLGRSWQRVPWENDRLGGFLSFGQDNAGAIDSYIYIYYMRPGDDNNVYLQRVPQSSLTADPNVAGIYEYLTGVDKHGNPVSWSFNEADAGPIFTDPKGASAEVVYNAPLRRYLLTAAHNPKRTMETDSAGQVGLFEGKNPWGPWSTVGYYDNWGHLGQDSFGDFLGLRFPAKWISSDGKTLWAVFSSLGKYDSFNLVKATLTVRGSR